MFKFSDLKLYRKFLILALLIGGLFLVSSIDRAKATSCCSECGDDYLACSATCQALYAGSPNKIYECEQTVCFPPYFECMNSGCDSGC